MKVNILGIFEILNKVEEVKTKKEKIDLLRHFKSEALLSVLQGAFDARIVWALPPGEVPFKAAPGEGLETALYKQVRTFYLFAENGVPGLNQIKRETLFIQLLESIHPQDANILVHAKDKTLPYKSITPELIAEAFPELNLVPVKRKKVSTGKSENTFQEDTTDPVQDISGNTSLEVSTNNSPNDENKTVVEEVTEDKENGKK